MTIRPDQQATLTQGHFTTLARTFFGPCRVTLTGLSGEFTSIPFRISRRSSEGKPFEASEASVPFGFGTRRIEATTPQGVATLDIVYEVRTGPDV